MRGWWLWVIGILALVAVYGGWQYMRWDMEQRAVKLEEHWGTLSDEELAEDLLVRSNNLVTSFGEEGHGDEIDGLLLEAAKDPGVRARARERRDRRVEQRRPKKPKAAAEETSILQGDGLLMVLLVVLVAVVLGSAIAGVLMLARPRDEEEDGLQ